VSRDDDWFERALADEGDDRTATDGDESRDDDTGSEDDGGRTPPTTDAEDSPFEPPDRAGRTDTDSPFQEDFSEAFDSAPVPGADLERGAPDGRSEAVPGPNGSGHDDGDLFAGEDDLGFPGSEFDQEQFDSDLERIEIGIDGLDEMILGGVPARSLIAAIGSAGTGKTTVGLQFLNETLEDGGRAVFITLEETRERILSTAAEKGWEFRQYDEDGRLAVVDLNPIEMANSLGSIRNDLARLIGEFGADRVVLDSVSLLEMMYDHPARRRSEVFQFTQTLKAAGVTVLVTSEASDTDPYASRHGIVEYLADAVFVLKYVRSNSFQETRLAIEIQKIRDANHSRQPKPYEITNEGISVHQRANLF
jgi:KaiC domain protein